MTDDKYADLSAIARLLKANILTSLAAADLSDEALSCDPVMFTAWAKSERRNRTQPMSHLAVQQVRQAFICYLLSAICCALRRSCASPVMRFASDVLNTLPCSLYA